MISNEDFKAIAELDLDPIKVKIMHEESGEGWSLEKANAVEFEYRRFLYLMKAFPNEETAPLFDVDTFWHYHILDTMKYAVDCENVFGYFLHHFPYLGLRGEDDEAAHQRVGDRMKELYEETFGEDYIRTAAASGTAAWSGATAKTAWSGATAGQAKTAWSGATAGQQAKTAWSGATAGQAKTAWSGATAQTAWSGATAGQQARTAWSGATAGQAKTAWSGATAKAAWSGATAGQGKTAWSGATAAQGEKTAWSGATAKRAAPEVPSLYATRPRLPAAA
ncbi:MAG: hypothetical protein V4463_24485 [Pseudomonadota bacterium]